MLHNPHNCILILCFFWNLVSSIQLKCSCSSLKFWQRKASTTKLSLSASEKGAVKSQVWIPEIISTNQNHLSCFYICCILLLQIQIFKVSLKELQCMATVVNHNFQYLSIEFGLCRYVASYAKVNVKHTTLLKQLGKAWWISNESYSLFRLYLKKFTKCVDEVISRCCATTALSSHVSLHRFYYNFAVIILVTAVVLHQWGVARQPQDTWLLVMHAKLRPFGHFRILGDFMSPPSGDVHQKKDSIQKLNRAIKMKFQFHFLGNSHFIAVINVGNFLSVKVNFS